MAIPGYIRAAMVAPTVADIYNDRAPRYDGDYPRASDRAEDALVATMLAPLVREASSVLDLGCGTGWLLDKLGPLVRDYHGVDVSEGMLERARDKHPDRTFTCGDMAKVDLGESADLIVSTFGSVSYVHPLEVAEIVYSTLRPGGRFFLQAYAPAYQDRRTYTAREARVGQTWWTPGLARETFKRSWVRGLRARGLWSPVCEWMGHRYGADAAYRFGALEHRTRGRAPHGMYWLVVTGQRRGNAAS